MPMQALIVGISGLIAAGAVAIGMTARSKRISIGALLVNAVTRYVAPDLDGPLKLERAIARDRIRGPALPPRRLRRRMRFSEMLIEDSRQYALAQVDGNPIATLLYLHGGAFLFEVQSVQWNLIDGLLKHLPANVVAPIYPLAPEKGWQDSLQAVERSFLALAVEIGAENIVLVGDSAGGGLALLLAQRLRDTAKPLPAALVLISPWLDLCCSGDDQPALEARDPALSIAFLRAAARLWARELPTDDPRISPLFGDLAGLPPTIAFSGGRDILASDAFRLATRAPTMVHRHYEEMIHVWPAAPIREGKFALREAAEFITKHINLGTRKTGGFAAL